MILEDYCSYEVSKLLKEKGFDEEVLAVYIYDKLFVKGENEIVNTANVPIIPAPTHQMVMKWLREEKHYYIQIMLDSWALGGHTGYYVVIQRIDNDFEIMLQDALDEVFYNSYEDAVEATLKYCLENLL